MKQELRVTHAGKVVAIDYTTFDKVQKGEAFFDSDENQWVKINAAEGHVKNERTLLGIFCATEPVIRLTTTDYSC